MTRSTLPPEVSAPQGTGCEPNKVSTRETDKEESKTELKSNSDQDTLFRVNLPDQEIRREVPSVSNVYAHSKADCKLRLAYFITPQKAAERGTYD